MSSKFLDCILGSKDKPCSVRDMAVLYEWQFIGTWYKWGGDDPMGFDCSGLQVEMGKAIGLLPRYSNGVATDWTSQMLRDDFIEYKVDTPYKGCWVFFHHPKNVGKIIHIEFCINNTFAIGASGGGSKTLTIEDAMRHNAFIKMRPIYSRKYIADFIDPFLKLAKE